MKDHDINMLNLRTECCNVFPVFEINTIDGKVIYEPWDYCPSCLKVTSIYNWEQRAYEERIKKIQLTDRKLNGIIKRKIKELHSEAISLSDDEDSETSCICKCSKGKSSCNK